MRKRGGGAIRQHVSGFWAKAGPDGYHPLIGHSADVAAVFCELVKEGSNARRRLEQLARAPDGELLAQSLAYYAALHDLGKANHGFQDKAGPWSRPDRAVDWQVSGHVAPVIGSFTADASFKRMVAGLLEPVPIAQDLALEIFLTSVCHHGQPLDTSGRTLHPSRWSAIWAPDKVSGRDPIAEIQRLAAFALEISGLPSDVGRNQTPWNDDVSNLFAGLLTTADWLGSHATWFEFSPEADEDPIAYWARARRQAREAVRAVGLASAPPRFSSVGSARYAELFPTVFQRSAPTRLQELGATIELPAPGCRLVIESDTGSGKTEAILALYSRLREAERVDGLVFALPTRATATAMHERILEALPHLSASCSRPTVSLAMGGQSGGDGGAKDAARLYPDDIDRLCYRWASLNSKTFFGAEIVVGTVDQVLLAGLPVKHAHLRLALLGRHLIVVDEIHSCDRYMNRILTNVVDFHSRAGGVTAFLSATLSRGARMGLIGATDVSSEADAVAVPYPAISIKDAEEEDWVTHPAPSSRPTKHVRWELSDETTGLRRAVQLAGKGGRVCILRNTVKDALRTTSWLNAEAPELTWKPVQSVDHRPPYHSRYSAPDRRMLDHAALRDFGKKAGRDGAGTILVSTQVVEQSLDVDFDWMMLDLAPIDVVLQRIGRLHRHDRTDRPDDMAEPKVLIQAPMEMFEPRAGTPGPHGWGTVYPSWLDLELTRQLITTQSTIRIPELNRDLIEAVYHADARARFVFSHPAWSGAADHDEGVKLGREAHAHMAALQLDRSYPKQAPQFRQAREEKIRTRLGDDRIEVRLSDPVSAWYAVGESSHSVALALPQLARAGVEDFVDVVAQRVSDKDGAFNYQVGKTGALQYTPFGWLFRPRG